MGNDAFSELQTRLGWNLQAYGAIRADVRVLLDPTRTLTYDWMHVMVVSGVGNRHVGLALKALPSAVRLQLGAYVASWTWPGRVRGALGQVKEVLVGQRLASSLKSLELKCTASEFMGLYPPLANFAAVVLMHSADAAAGIVDGCSHTTPPRVPPESWLQT